MGCKLASTRRTVALMLAIFGGAMAPAAAQTSARSEGPPPTDYVVGPQDMLTITSYDQADLSGKFAVEADGTFTYPLIGRVRAGGLTLRASSRRS